MSDDPALLSRKLNSDQSRSNRDGLPVYRQLPSSTLTQPADLELSVSIELGRVRMRMADVLQLTDGCVLELDKSTDEPVDVVINDQVVARGEVVVLNGKFAVRVLQVVSTVEPTQGVNLVRARFILLAVMLLAAVPVAFSQTSQPSQATQSFGDGEIHRSASGGAATTSNLTSRQQPFDTLRVVGALAAVVALIVLLRFGIKRMAPGAMRRSSRGVRVVGRTYVGPKQQILIVQIGRRVLVVGDSGQNLRTLAEITDPDEIAGLIGESLPAATAERPRETRAVQTPWDDSPPKASDPAMESARSELNGLADRVRILAKHLNRA